MKRRNLSLLRAAYDLLRRSTQDHYVHEATSILTRYDDVDCDGYCLMEDIATELNLDDDAEPIPLETEKKRRWCDVPSTSSASTGRHVPNGP